MKIIVCVKQVPSTNEVRLDPVTKTILRDGRQAVINPFDLHAIEEAVCLREQHGGSVTALSMGIPATERLLRDTMARGVDASVLLTDRAFAGSDTLATSYALSLGVRKIGDFDLIICGKMAVDGDTAQIGPELSAQLGIPYLTEVRRIIKSTKTSLICERRTDFGFAEAEIRLPALITVSPEINMPRFASIAGVRASLEAPFRSFTAEEVGADASRCGLNGSPTQVVRSFTPDRAHRASYLSGTLSENAEAVRKLYEEVR